MFARITQSLSILALSLFCILSAGPLQDYVNKPDDHYRWAIRSQTKIGGCHIYRLEMRSQKWRDKSEVNKPVWKHEMTIVVPDDLRHSTPVLLIDGGNRGAPPLLPPHSVEMAYAANSMHTIVCSINCVPNQWLKFTDEPNPHHAALGRREDALVAYSWHKFFSTNDPEWIVQLPMTKSVTKAMDTVEEFCALAGYDQAASDGFILLGFSKRGWTTWTTALSDTRVRAIIPLVYDALNLKQAFLHHIGAYGKWSHVLSDYIEIGLQNQIHLPQFERLRSIVDPYVSKEKLHCAKYLINATGDQFFLLDSSRLYFHELPEPKHLLYQANTDHSLYQSDYLFCIMGYVHAFLQKRPMPQLKWEMKEGGVLAVFCDTSPKRALLWQAHNEQARDFRQESIGKSWVATEIFFSGQSTRYIPLQVPNRGWSAYYVELIFEQKEAFPLRFSTDIIVLPQELPFQETTAPLEKVAD